MLDVGHVKRIEKTCSMVRRESGSSNLEALVLQYSLDRGIFVARRKLCLKDDTERPIANDSAMGVCEFFMLARSAVLNLFTDHLWILKLANWRRI